MTIRHIEEKISDGLISVGNLILAVPDFLEILFVMLLLLACAGAVLFLIGTLLWFLAVHVSVLLSGCSLFIIYIVARTLFLKGPRNKRLGA